MWNWKFKTFETITEEVASNHQTKFIGGLKWQTLIIYPEWLVFSALRAVVSPCFRESLWFNRKHIWFNRKHMLCPALVKKLPQSMVPMAPVEMASKGVFNIRPTVIDKIRVPKIRGAGRRRWSSWSIVFCCGTVGRFVIAEGGFTWMDRLIDWQKKRE